MNVGGRAFQVRQRRTDDSRSGTPSSGPGPASATRVGFLPWQQSAAASWLGRRERFSHAWLLHGLPGIGKTVFVRAAAASLLCESPQSGLACGVCQACGWVAGGNHPDLRLIRPDAVAVSEGGEAGEGGGDTGAARRAPSRDIRVEQLRALHDWFNVATHRGGWRVAVLYPAEALNLVSANALLKVLEEPPPNTVFLLVAEAPDRLLPTLVSRCRRMPMAVPPLDDSTPWLRDQGVDAPAEWLAAAGGAPMRALALARSGQPACPPWLLDYLRPLAGGEMPDIGATADTLEGDKTPPDVWLDILQRVLVDMQLAAIGQPVRYFPAVADEVAAIGRTVSPARLSELSRRLAQQRRVAAHPLNVKLFLHSLLDDVARHCRAAG